jgi:hypothetical protein
MVIRNCFILITIQKIAPLILISYTINLNVFLNFIIISLLKQLKGVIKQQFENLKKLSFLT